MPPGSASCAGKKFPAIFKTCDVCRTDVIRPNDDRMCAVRTIVEKSRYLDHLEEIAGVFQLDDGTFFHGEWKQYGVYTQNHIIEIISHCPPVVTRIQQRGADPFSL